MACTIIIVMQVAFLKNTDRGFDRKLVLMVPVGNLSDSQQEQLRATMVGDATSFSPSVFATTRHPVTARGGQLLNSVTATGKSGRFFLRLAISAYCHTFGIQLIAGRNIHAKTPVPEYMINETMAKLLHVKKCKRYIRKKPGSGGCKRHHCRYCKKIST